MNQAQRVPIFRYRNPVDYHHYAGHFAAVKITERNIDELPALLGIEAKVKEQPRAVTVPVINKKRHVMQRYLLIWPSEQLPELPPQQERMAFIGDYLVKNLGQRGPWFIVRSENLGSTFSYVGAVQLRQLGQLGRLERHSAPMAATEGSTVLNNGEAGQAERSGTTLPPAQGLAEANKLYEQELVELWGRLAAVQQQARRAYRGYGMRQVWDDIERAAARNGITDVEGLAKQLCGVVSLVQLHDDDIRALDALVRNPLLPRLLELYVPALTTIVMDDEQQLHIETLRLVGLAAEVLGTVDTWERGV